MEYELNKRIVENVLKHIPKNKKPVIYLVNTLNISRESAYRRLRGDIPFTIEELITLATHLNFSIDVIYDQEKQNYAFYDFSRMEKNTTDFFAFMLKKYDEVVGKIKYAKKLEAIMTFNTFPPPFYAGFLNLFKFMFYKWLHQSKEIYRNKPYSETVLPDEAIIFQRKMKGNFILGNNVILILDMNIFLNLMKEIQYFYHRKLLTNEDLLLLREDTIRLIDQYENIVQTGKYGFTEIQLYLSSLCVNSNTVYYEYDDKIEPLFWIFTVNPIIIRNTGFVSMQKKWLNLIRRQSTLITQSNEIMQAEFFFQQREYIDKYLSIDNAM